MKFDAVVGNPPYHEEMQEDSALGKQRNKMSVSIYPDFVKLADKISNRFTSLIFPARWMSGENGPYRETKDFVNYMIKDHNQRAFYLFPNSKDVFGNGIDIKGGILFNIRDKQYDGQTKFVIFEQGNTHSYYVSFVGKEEDNIIIRFAELYSMVEKINFHGMHSGSMKKLVSSRNPYGFVSDLFVKNNERAHISEVKQNEDDYLVHGLIGNKRVTRYILNSDLKKNIKGAQSYKVFLPRANGSGAFGEVFSTPMIGMPMQIATDTFLEVGQFDNELEAVNLLKYVKSKFFRAMVGVKKTAVFNYKDAFTFVPLQDFTSKSDIDWTKPIPDIDKQLYAKYKLTKEEIAFIESKISAMD